MNRIVSQDVVIIACTTIGCCILAVMLLQFKKSQSDDKSDDKKKLSRSDHSKIVESLLKTVKDLILDGELFFAVTKVNAAADLALQQGMPNDLLAILHKTRCGLHIKLDMFAEASQDAILALECDSSLSDVRYWHDFVIPKAIQWRDLVLDANDLKNKQQYSQTISKVSEALAIATELAIFPKKKIAEMLVMRSYCRNKMKQFEEALEDAVQALHCDPSNATAVSLHDSLSQINCLLAIDRALARGESKAALAPLYDARSMVLEKRGELIAATVDVLKAVVYFSNDPSDECLARKTRLLQLNQCAAGAGSTDQLCQYVSHGDFDSMCVLLARYPQLANIPSGQSRMTPLHHAVLTGQVDIVRLLLACDADINVQSAYGCTPIIEAFSNYGVCNVDVIRLLIDNGADVNIIDRTKKSACHHAAARGNAAALALIIPHVADVNRRDGLHTPLEHACMDGHLDAMRLLVEHGADVNTRCSLNCTPLRAAVSSGNPAAVSYLLSKGADASVVHSSGETLVQFARNFPEMMNEVNKAIRSLNLSSNPPDQNIGSSSQNMDDIVAILS
jgi:ankyrin repeat protein